MSVTVSIMSKKYGEINKFFKKHIGEDSDLDDNVIEWIYVYKDSVQAKDIMNTVMNNRCNYDISLWIQIEDQDITEVTAYNQQKITHDILNV